MFPWPIILIGSTLRQSCYLVLRGRYILRHAIDIDSAFGDRHRGSDSIFNFLSQTSFCGSVSAKTAARLSSRTPKCRRSLWTSRTSLSSSSRSSQRRSLTNYASTLVSSSTKMYVVLGACARTDARHLRTLLLSMGLSSVLCSRLRLLQTDTTCSASRALRRHWQSSKERQRSQTTDSSCRRSSKP